MKFSIIGCGRTGINLAVYLTKSGFEPTGFFSKSRSSAQKARQAVNNTGQIFDEAEQACQNSDILFITTPDDTIESVCSYIASKNGFKNAMSVFHLSGALSSEILNSAKKSGSNRSEINIGSIHPLQSFTPYEKGQTSPFAGINISVEGTKSAVRIGEKIVTALNANYFTIPTDTKMLYHAAAVVASNYLVTLEAFAIKLLQKADLSEKKAYEILEPLIMGTLNNIKNKGSVQALTGPVARGDSDIVSSHINAIEKDIPDFTSLYKAMGKYTLDIAKQRKEISSEQIGKLSKLFNQSKAL
ncbi:MAG: DUF2520 domain-containing protein [Desulfobacteraceae bacterium]|nr:DUF2520 domain-containing protein [Desulfobacteraceae bacterium]